MEVWESPRISRQGFGGKVQGTRGAVSPVWDVGDPRGSQGQGFGVGRPQGLRVKSLTPHHSPHSVALGEEDALVSKVGPVSPDPPSPQGPFPAPEGLRRPTQGRPRLSPAWEGPRARSSVGPALPRGPRAVRIGAVRARVLLGS